MESKEWDVFVSHASEDNVAVAHPLAETLRRAGARVWLDEQELTVGDSLSEKIDEGLARSRFGVVILSSAFFAKHWPKKELAGLRAREEEGRKVILPVWHNVDKATISQFSPVLADLVAANTSQGIDAVAEKLLRAIIPAAIGDGSSEHKAEATAAPKAHNQATQALINQAASQPWRAAHGAWQSVRRAAKSATPGLQGEKLTTEARVQHLHDEGAVDDGVLQSTWTLRRRYYDMKKESDALTSRDVTDFVEKTSSLVKDLLIAAPGEPSASAKPNKPQDP